MWEESLAGFIVGLNIADSGTEWIPLVECSSTK